ncbi:nucleoside triphosphate pyrophosphohydrolase family protein [Aeribacillus composti]|uniref:nucleoside triphosphate pyrophosphohydrolase family protein n=1 Tax=Aeribacillus composti TaxID=1868734 RepID=UPI00119C73DF|nr:nucleoside triphosphate pyrophosphohydrolase family protein [Aeribacillus composti]MDR9795243.1 nucleoside triphosphate pyrophosphohydrolase family protein [Aeribacillus pallidus]TVZ81263.1 NTP pyrophosphatase (non-canonical NTP hydrolase) [Aeribacillus composti]
MNLNEYQKLAGRTANLKDEALTNFALGVAGEAGEVADLVKKHVFHGHPLEREEMIKELGDVLWYVSQLAAWMGIELNEVARKNIEKLMLRYPNGFSKEASRERAT